MFEARFQSFDDSHERARSAGARRRACAPSSSAAGSTASSCRAPTASRTNICRRARSGWPGSPASPARPAPPSCWPSARRCSSTAATPCRRTAQIDAKLFAIEHLVDNPPEQWLEQNLKSGAKLGYDPWLHTAESAEKLRKACATAGAELVAVDSNPIDALWSDRPAPPAGPGDAARHQARRRKRRRQAQAHPAPSSTKLRADALVVSDPQNVAWAFNIRGADVAHTPLALAFAVIPREGRPALYVDGGQARQQRAPRAGGDRRRARARRACPRPRATQGQDRAARPGERRRRAHAPGGRQRRQAGARRRSDRADEGGEEPRRDRRHAAPRTSATARRWCASSPGSSARRRRAS